VVYRLAIVVLGLFLTAAASAARAENVIVIPGRADVPVVINNYDARWRVVEGEEGLNRPGHVVPNVIGGRFVGPIRGEFRRGGYFPTTGAKPEQGRLELEPSGPAPTSAENFSRTWSSAPSPTAPATMGEPVPPADLPNPVPLGEGVNPPVIVAPQFGPGRGH
jgi:hypothetical protein